MVNYLWINSLKSYFLESLKSCGLKGEKFKFSDLKRVRGKSHVMGLWFTLVTGLISLMSRPYSHVSDSRGSRNIMKWFLVIFSMLFKIKVLFPIISLLSSTWPTPYPGACTTCQWINIIWFVTHYLSITVETRFILKRAPCFTTVITFIHYGGTRACMAWLVWFWKKESSKGIYYQLGYILLWILHTFFLLI